MEMRLKMPTSQDVPSFDVNSPLKDLQGPLYFYALRMLRDVHRALDATQDTLFKIHQKKASWSGKASFKSWAFRILRNSCIDQIRMHPPHFSLESLLEKEGFDCEDRQGPRPEEILIQSERQKALWKVLGDLDDDYREIIFLKDFDNLKYREIAELLDIPKGTVMSRLHKAREILRLKLKGLS
jgi:RNA polymerase sigma-70 factor (ECF subfamily)